MVRKQNVGKNREGVDHELTGRINVRLGPELERIARELAKKVEADDLSDYIRGALFLHAAKAKVNLDDVPMPLWLRKAGLVNLSMKLT